MSTPITNISAVDRVELSRKVYEERKCLNCKRRFTLWEALAMVFGCDYRYVVRVQFDDGQRAILPVEKVNPQIMDVIDD